MRCARTPSCLVLAKADRGKLGIGKGNAGNLVAVFSRRNAQQVLLRTSGVVIGGVGELRASGDVADRINALLAVRRCSIDDDAGRRLRRYPPLEAEALGAHLAPRGDKQVACLDREFSVGGLVE